jgi:hypothetical protein
MNEQFGFMKSRASLRLDQTSFRFSSEIQTDLLMMRLLADAEGKN